MRHSRKNTVLAFILTMCLAVGFPAVIPADESPDSAPASSDQESVRLNNISDLTPLQWSSSDASEYHLAGCDNSSIHVPNFGPTGSNMEGEPVVIAVIDTPIDFTNPDIAPVAYTFTPEQQKALGCDVHGFNATIQSGDGLLTNSDHASHGTHCAGIIGAAWDGQGISGVASNVRLISVQNCTEDGLTSLTNAMRAFDFIDRANEAGCGISLVSCSWNMLQANENLNAMIQYLGEKWGIVTIIAAGNEEADLALSDPDTGALYQNPYAVIVGATDCSGNLAAYSCYGKQIVDLAAPGSGILSTVCTEESECEYFADAVPESNKLYEGFEGEEVKVTAELASNGEEKMESIETGTITDDSHFSGSHSLKINLDPENAAGTEDSSYIYWITLNLGDLSEADIQPGDYFGFTYGGRGSFVINSVDYWNPVSEEYEILVPKTTYSYSYSDSWVNCYVQLPELADPTDTVFSLTLVTDENLDAVYLDAVGIGTQKVPYSIYNGTSMAAPAVTGVAAVIKSAHPDLSGAELADSVKSSVRPMASLSDSLQSGGMIDFLAADQDAKIYSPVIHQVEAAGKTVTIKGVHFGENGNALLSRYIAGNEPEKVNAAVEKWADDCVTLSLDSEFDGILQAELQNSAGGKDTAVQFVSKRNQIYEEALPIDQDLGELFVFDAAGDWETSGPLIGMDGRLYYLPAVTKVELTPAHKILKCYDITDQTWSELPELPEWLSYVSAAACNGKIYVMGLTMTPVAEDTFYNATEPEARIYVFDPSDQSWTAAPTEGVLKTDTLAGDNDQLFLVGSGSSKDEASESVLLPATVRPYNPDTGAGEPICTLAEELIWPAVAVKDGIICTYDPYTGIVERVRDGKSELLEDAFSEYIPEIAANETQYYWLPKRTGVLLPISDGFLLVGPAARDGSGDSFLLSDEETVFTPYEKRMSDSKVFYPAAASFDGKVYVIGSTLFEPNQRFFRATSFNTAETAGVAESDQSAEGTADQETAADTNISSDANDSANADNSAVTDEPANSDNASVTDDPAVTDNSADSENAVNTHRSYTALWIILIIAGAAAVVILLLRRKKNQL